MPEMQEMQIWPLGQEDSLEKEMATHSSIITWEIPWTEEAGGVQSIGSQESDTTEHACTDSWRAEIWGIIKRLEEAK